MLFTRRIVRRFTPEEQEEYNRLSQQPRQSLARFLPDGTLCWNRGAARKLILLSTSLSFHHLESSMTADSIKKWKDTPNLLWEILKLLRIKQGNLGRFTLPRLFMPPLFLSPFTPFSRHRRVFCHREVTVAPFSCRRLVFPLLMPYVRPISSWPFTLSSHRNNMASFNWSHPQGHRNPLNDGIYLIKPTS